VLHQLDPARCPLVAKGDATDMATKVLDNVQAMGLRPFLKVVELYIEGRIYIYLFQEIDVVAPFFYIIEVTFCKFYL
jgi:hypothetical protein